MLALQVALALVQDLLLLIKGHPGAEPREGTQGEAPISFPINLELLECLWHEWMSPEQIESDQLNACRHWNKLHELGSRPALGKPDVILEGK